MESYMDNIENLITLYTNQLESIDQLIITYIMTCIGFVGVIIGIIATLLTKENRKNDPMQKIQIYRASSALFALIPIIICIYVATATLSSRKVSMYRIYLVYLENIYNSDAKTVKLQFNNDMLHYLSKYSENNTDGSMMNTVIIGVYIVVVLIAIFSCFYFAFHYLKSANKLLTSSKKLKIKSPRSYKIMYSIYVIMVIICIVISYASLNDLWLKPLNTSDVINHLNEIHQ